MRTANAQSSPRTSRTNPRTIVVWTLVALVGATGWAVLALARGENVSAAWTVAAALAVCTTLLVKSGRLKWAWITGVPLAWDATVTLTASCPRAPHRRGDRGRGPVCVRHVRRPALSTLSEAKYVESKIVAPAGLFPTPEEKEEARDAVAAGQGG